MFEDLLKPIRMDNGDRDPQLLSSIAESMSYTKSGVGVIERRALGKLHQALADRGINSADDLLDRRGVDSTSGRTIPRI
jgi:hypothetical protein